MPKPKDGGRSHSYIPVGLWYAMVQVLMKYSTPEKPISMKEVEMIDALTNAFGFKCSHPEERITTNREGKTYCKWCWRRLEVKRKRELRRIVNEYKVIPGSYK